MLYLFLLPVALLYVPVAEDQSEDGIEVFRCPTYSDIDPQVKDDVTDIYDINP